MRVSKTPVRWASRRAGAGAKSEAGETPALSRNCIPGSVAAETGGARSPAFVRTTSLRGKAWASRRNNRPLPDEAGVFRFVKPPAFRVHFGRYIDEPAQPVPGAPGGDRSRLHR